MFIEGGIQVQKQNFQFSKSRTSNLTLTMLLIPGQAHILFTKLCAVAATQLIMVKLFVRVSDRLDIAFFTGKFVKMRKKFATFDIG